MAEEEEKNTVEIDADELYALQEEVKSMKNKYRQLELKKKEGELNQNKNLSELQSLRSQVRIWRQGAIDAYTHTFNYKIEMEQRIRDLEIYVYNFCEAKKKVLDDGNRSVVHAKAIVYGLQETIKRLEREMEELKDKLSRTEVDLREKTVRLNFLQKSLDAEVNRLVLPWKERMTKSMAMVMREKAQRAQERRELAELWPVGHLMPTMLIRFRDMNPAERQLRIDVANERNASAILAAEIRANMFEATLWKPKFDEYGRAYFQHSVTGESSWERPPVMDYQPPVGRDEMGNLIGSGEDMLANWEMISDDRGIITYRNKLTNEETKVPPSLYQKLPPAKSDRLLAKEAAEIVITYIKGKIAAHIQKLKDQQEEYNKAPSDDDSSDEEEEEEESGTLSDLENPEEADRQRKAKEEERAEQKRKKEEDEDRKRKDDEDLSVYMYDIETVEMLAAASGLEKDRPRILKTQQDDEEKARNEAMLFNRGAFMRVFDHVAFEKPLLFHMDADELTVPEVRTLLEKMASNEEKLERRLAKTRENLKDFSLLLTEKLQEDEDEVYEKLDRKSAMKKKKEGRLTMESGVSGAKGGGGSQLQSLEGSDDEEESEEEDEKEKDKESEESSDDDDDHHHEHGDHDEASVVKTLDNVSSDIAALNALKAAKRGLSGDIITRTRKMPVLLLGDPSIGDASCSTIVPESMITLSNNLATLALFCGYANMLIDSAPETMRMGIQQQLKSDTFNRQDDDAWMTGNFFLTVSQERLDAIREALTLKQNPTQGFVRERTKMLHLDTLTLSKDTIQPPDAGGEPPELASTTAASSATAMAEGTYKLRYGLWKARQYLVEVLQHQIQQEAVRDIIENRRFSPDEQPQKKEQNIGDAKLKFIDHVGKFVVHNSRDPTVSTRDTVGGVITQNVVESAEESRYYKDGALSIVKVSEGKVVSKSVPVTFTVTRIEVTLNLPSSYALMQEQKQYVRLTLGAWTTRTKSRILRARHKVIWHRINLGVIMTLQALKYGGQMLIEVINSNLALDDAVIGTASIAVNHLLDEDKTGTEVDLESPLFDRRRRPTVGSISLTVEAERANHMKQSDKDLIGVEPKKLLFEELIRSRAEQYEERIKTMTTILKEDDPADLSVAIGTGMKTTIPAGAEGSSKKPSVDGIVAKGSVEGGSLVDGNVVAGSIEESSISKIEDGSLVEGGSSVSKLENEGAEAGQETDQVGGPGDAPSLVAGGTGSLRGSKQGSKQNNSVRGSSTSQPGKAAASSKGSTHTSSVSDEQEPPDDEEHAEMVEDDDPFLHQYNIKVRAEKRADDFLKQQSAFEALVADLRGDGNNVDLLKRTLAAANLDVQELLSMGHRVGSHFAQKLPDFKQVSVYLESKTKKHLQEMVSMVSEIEASHRLVDKAFEEKRARCMEAIATAKTVYAERLQKLNECNDVVAELDANLIVEGVSDPLPPPEKVELDGLPPIPYVRKLPTVASGANLDTLGRVKRPLPGSAMKSWAAEIEQGEWDDKDWDFGMYFPSNSQLGTLFKVIAKRNLVVDEERASLLKLREKADVNYEIDVKTWEFQESLRIQRLGFLKKGFRKAYLRFDLAQERADRQRAILDRCEADLATLERLVVIHTNAKHRYQILRVKQLMESDRLTDSIDVLHRQLLGALGARVRALELPGAATDELTFQDFCKQSDESLRCLRFEILDLRERLVGEGANLRTLLREEFNGCKNEQTRSKMMKEYAVQVASLDGIVIRNKYDANNLYEALEDLIVFEADKDDIGIEGTIQKEGFRYLKEKEWKSADIDRCKKTIALVNAKIAHAEGVSITALNNANYFVESLTTQWKSTVGDGGDGLPTLESIEGVGEDSPDSWIIKSEYTRTRQMQEDIVKWVTMQLKKLSGREKLVQAEVSDLRLQVAAVEDHMNAGLRAQEVESSSLANSTVDLVDKIRDKLAEAKIEAVKVQAKMEERISTLAAEIQETREIAMQQQLKDEETIRNLWSLIYSLQSIVTTSQLKMEQASEEKEKVVILSRLSVNKARHELKAERTYCCNLQLVIHSQRGRMSGLRKEINDIKATIKAVEMQRFNEAQKFRKDLWEHIYSFTRLGTDVDFLFEFFAGRLANLAGSRKAINDAMARNGASHVLAALCKSPRPLIRKHAARALGGFGWNGYVETRILMWDCAMYWKIFKAQVIEKEKTFYEKGLRKFEVNGDTDIILNIEGHVDEFVPPGNMSLRAIIKQRRQWALRATRRNEGPNVNNQRLLNIKDGVIPALLHLALQDGAVDWEIARNGALALSIASYELQNHQDMIDDAVCVKLIVDMCLALDPEVKMYAAVTVANLSHKDESAQIIFGNSDAVPALLKMCYCDVVDLLEAATSALANLTCYCDANCRRVMECDGVKAIVRVLASTYSENLLDSDQNDEVQANAAELLANVSRFNGELTAQYFDAPVLDSLMLMCAARNKQVRRHAPLVLGNIAQNEECRDRVGDRGGIEALFIVLESNDTTMQANALWALCNLTWNQTNQERAGRFMPDIFKFLISTYHPVKVQGNILMSNVLYYNGPNRARFLEIEGSTELLLQYIDERSDKTIVESGLRSVLSLSYLDSVSMWLGGDGDMIPLFISFLKEPYYTRDSMRCSLEIVCNLCVHVSNRNAILRHGGIDALVSLHVDDDFYIRELSMQILDHLKDVTPAEVLIRAKVGMGLERMVTLATGSDQLNRAYAAEAIGEEIWNNPNSRHRVVEVGGVEALLAMCHKPNEPLDSLLPSLWSLRNILQDNPQAQEQFAHREGMSVMNSLLQRSLSGSYAENTEKVMESALYCMLGAVHGHERNHRQLLKFGLDTCMDIEECIVPKTMEETQHVKQALKAESIASMAKTIVAMLGDFNYSVCTNCYKKQEMKGLNCLQCGYKLPIEVPIPEGLSEDRKMRMAAVIAGVNKRPPAGGPLGGFGTTLPSKRKNNNGGSGNMLLSASAPHLQLNQGGSGSGGEANHRVIGMMSSGPSPLNVSGSTNNNGTQGRVHSANTGGVLGPSDPSGLDDDILRSSSAQASRSSNAIPGSTTGKGKISKKQQLIDEVNSKFFATDPNVPPGAR